MFGDDPYEPATVDFADERQPPSLPGLVVRSFVAFTGLSLALYGVAQVSWDVGVPLALGLGLPYIVLSTLIDIQPSRYDMGGNDYGSADQSPFDGVLNLLWLLGMPGRLVGNVVQDWWRLLRG